MTREPVAILGAVIAALTAVQDAISGGVDLSTAVLMAAVALLTGLQRSKVYPSKSVQDVTVDAYLQGAYDAVVDGKGGRK